MEALTDLEKIYSRNNDFDESQDLLSMLDSFCLKKKRRQMSQKFTKQAKNLQNQQQTPNLVVKTDFQARNHIPMKPGVNDIQRSRQHFSSSLIGYPAVSTNDQDMKKEKPLFAVDTIEEFGITKSEIGDFAQTCK